MLKPTITGGGREGAMLLISGLTIRFGRTIRYWVDIRERCKKKKLKKKLTSVSFMYVCVAENGEMLVFFRFFPNNSLIDNSLSE